MSAQNIIIDQEEEEKENNQDQDEEEKEKEEENNQEIEEAMPPTFYEKIGDKISLDFEKLSNLVITRYNLLKDVEYFSRKKLIIYRIIRKKIPINLSWLSEESINNDIASHFLLALIMVKNDKDMNWFIYQESLLYYSRLIKFRKDYPKYNMYKILSLLGLKLNLFDENSNNDNIDINKIKFRRKHIQNEKIYFINFIDGINLLPSRSYYLHKGNLYIPEKDLPKLFIRVFQKKQESILSKIKLNAENIKKDRRIKEIILSFEKEKEKFIIKENLKIAKEVNNDHKIKLMKDVDKYSEQCFPLCMCLIERHLNKYSHLMNLGRLQYTLFLKSIGLPVEEAVKFFKKKFEKKTKSEQFDKQYTYYIRHAYGLEGKRTNYLPFNCDKLLDMNAPIGSECHGCPFKTKSAEELKTILDECNLNNQDIEDILINKKNGAYRMCCVKYWEGKFGTSEDGIGIHPTKYYYSAMKKIKGEKNANSNNINITNYITNNNINNNTNNNTNNINMKEDDKLDGDNNNIIIKENKKSKEKNEDINIIKEEEKNKSEEDDELGIDLDEFDINLEDI